MTIVVDHQSIDSINNKSTYVHDNVAAIGILLSDNCQLRACSINKLIPAPWVINLYAFMAISLHIASEPKQKILPNVRALDKANSAQTQWSSLLSFVIGSIYIVSEKRIPPNHQ